MSAAQQITLTIDGREVTVPVGTSVYDAARLAGIPIPTLCHLQNETPVGVCRLCVVEVERARVMQASCVRPAENGMMGPPAMPFSGLLRAAGGKRHGGAHHLRQAEPGAPHPAGAADVGAPQS